MRVIGVERLCCGSRLGHQLVQISHATDKAVDDRLSEHGSVQVSHKPTRTDTLVSLVLVDGLRTIGRHKPVVDGSVIDIGLGYLCKPALRIQVLGF